jgi:hypothetical protein
MKLYTEEQVKKAMDGFSDSDCSMQDVIDRLTPIELPSDDEINEAANIKYDLQIESFENDTSDFCSRDSFVLVAGFEDGAKWMKEQILNQNK